MGLAGGVPLHLSSGRGVAMSRLFGTSGVRGITGRDITPALVEALTCAYLRSLPGEGSVCVGYDTRAHAAELAHLAGGHVLMHGGACESLGVVPAGVICNHIQTSGCIGGIYITGSHLPEGHIGVILLDSMGDTSVERTQNASRR